MRLTISKYYLPSGKSISEVGGLLIYLLKKLEMTLKLILKKIINLNYAIKLFNS